MKLTKKQLQRLNELSTKAASNLNTDETSELQILQTKAAAQQIDDKSIDDEIDGAEDDTAELSEDEVQNLVTKAVKSAFAEHKSASSEEVADKVTAELAKKAVSEDKIRSIVSDVFQESVKSPSKMQFPEGGSYEQPFEHRAGNLTLAQKQLANLCLMKVSEEGLSYQGTKRPSGINDGISDSMLQRSKSANDVVISRMKHATKGLATTTSGSGAELVYTDLSTDLQRRLYLESDLAAALLSRELNMPTDPFKLPIKTVRTAFTAGSESPVPATLGAYLNYNNPTLAQITLDAKKMIGIASYSYEANEDSVVAILPMLQSDLAEGAAAAFESSILNGDADGTHQDTSAGYTSASVESLFNGIRKSGLAVGVLDWSTGGVSRANFMNARATMGKYGVAPSDLALIVSPFGYVQLQAIEEAFRADSRGGTNFGASAAINTGLIPSFNGIRVIVTEYLPAGVTSAGIQASGGTKETLLITNLTQWMVGVRRGFTVEVTSDPLVQTNYVVASFRRAFTQKETASASLPHTVLATNWG